MTATDTFVRARRTGRRPTKILRRAIVVVITTALALWLLAAVLDGFDIDSPVRRPAGRLRRRRWSTPWSGRLLAFVVVPDLGAHAGHRRDRARRAPRAAACSTRCPASTLDGFGTALVIVIGLAVIDDDRVVAAGARRRRLVRPTHGAHGARRRARRPTPTDVPGIVFVQLDGVAQTVLRRALRSGDVPDAATAGCATARHRLVGWETGWSSQTGVSQCGILHGSTQRHAGVPLGRQGDRARSSCPTARSRRPRSSGPTPTATACSPTTARATATCSPATPSGPC